MSGINELLRAEKAAAEQVAKARKRKAAMLKKAKEESEEEILQFKTQKENEFQAKLKEQIGANDTIAAKLRKETDQSIDAMIASTASHKQEVIDKLLDVVCDIKVTLHTNYKEEE